MTGARLAHPAEELRSGVAKSAPSKASEGPNPAKGTKGNLRGCWPIDEAAAALEREEVRRAVRDGMCSGVRTDAVRSAAGSEAESNTKEERAAPRGTVTARPVDGQPMRLRT